MKRREEGVEGLTEEQLVQKVIDYLKNGEKKEEQRKLGIEIEHIIVNEKDYHSIGYYGEEGVEEVLKSLEKKGYEGKYEGVYLIGLSKDTMEITLEPGGQLEFSTRPCLSIEAIKKVYEEFLQDIDPVLKKRKQLLLGIGYHPRTKIDEIPFNPKKRYEWMSEYLSKKGEFALNMMKGTASFQVAVDYTSKEDFIKKFRVANFLTPILYLLSDNSPIFEGEIYHGQGLRAKIWQGTDKDRSGSVPGVMEESFGYKEYGEFLVNMPAICIIEEGQLVPTGERKIKDIYRERKEISNKELEHLFTMAFPDVRCKNYIEIRVGDSMPKELLFAYLALIKGIFYHKGNVSLLYEKSLAFSDDDLSKALDSMMRDGFKGEYKDQTLLSLAKEALSLGKKGLSKEEALYLEPLVQILSKKKTFSQQLKEEIKLKGLTPLERVRIKP